MKLEYRITNEELAENGLDLNDYAIDGTYINAIINKGMKIVVARMCEIGDQFQSEKNIEDYLSVDDDIRTAEEKQDAFIEAQYNVIYNLVMAAETNPVDSMVDSILSKQLGCKINGFQKGLYYENY